MITEDQLEQLAIQWFQDTGWNYIHGAVIAPEGLAAEREDFRAVVLKGRLVEAVRRLNPKLPDAAVEEVVHVVTKPEHPSLVQNNRTFHRYLMDGVLVEFTNAKGEKEADHAQLVDFTWASRNDFLVVNQFTITGTKKPRRPALMCFVNGLPLGLIELKNPADKQADVWKAFDQLQTYQAKISDLQVFNEALVVSDGMNARVEKKNLAVELLERLLQGKIKAQTRTNLVQEKKYSDRLIEALRKYHNRMIESSQVIEEMIQMAKDMQEAMKRHEELGLNPDEEAFYDALADRPEVLLSMGDATLKKLASELTEKLRNSTTVDWEDAGCAVGEGAWIY